MRHIEKGLIETREFELRNDAVLVSRKHILSGTSEGMFPLAQLSTDVDRGMVKSHESPFVGGVLLVALIILSIYVFQTPSTNHSYFVEHQEEVTAAAVLFTFALIAVRPRVSVATFRWKSGGEAFAVRGPKSSRRYSEFVAAVEAAVSKPAAKAGAA